MGLWVQPVSQGVQVSRVPPVILDHQGQVGSQGRKVASVPLDLAVQWVRQVRMVDPGPQETLDLRAHRGPPDLKDLQEMLVYRDQVVTRVQLGQ